MKSKKWLISLGLAVVLVVAFALPACDGEKASGWYTPEDERISFDITTMPGDWADMALLIALDLQDLGMDVERRVIDSTTYYSKLYYPNTNGWDACISGEDTSPDPWSDWIWMMMCDPYDWGLEWNPSWFNNATLNDLLYENYLAANDTVKEAVLHEMQSILAEELPVVFLTRDDIITVRRTDTWDNWFNEVGRYVTWINEYSIREVTNLTADDQLRIATLTIVDNLLMDQEELQATNLGCLYLMLVYENLAGYPKIDAASLAINPDAAEGFVPKLATNCTWGTEGANQTLTIDLRPGVKWHDGEDFTADDVVYSFKEIITGWGINRPVDWVAVEANDWEILPEHILVEKISELQVKFTYIEDYHQNERFFPVAHMWYAIVPEHIFSLESDPEGVTGDYIGTGPYKLKEFRAGQYVLLERNEDYWGPKPAARQVLFTLYADRGPLFLALEAGHEDVTGLGAPWQKIDAYNATANLEVEIIKGLTTNYMAFNLHPDEGYLPFQDLALRKAIATAINKQDIIDMVMGGYSEIADSWTYQESLYHNPDLPQYAYNLAKARQMLLDAGYTYVAP